MVSKNLLLIFTRNPELGKCKTRLAATIGDQSALEIYKFLLNHTAALTQDVNAAKQVWYSEEIWTDDIWDTTFFDKRLQQGSDLGIRMANAFQEGFASGFERIIIIGSDMHDLDKSDIENAFDVLKSKDFVIGPAEDGGYYLFGMNAFNANVFQNKTWGTETVLKDTLNDLKNENVQLLEERNDIDIYEDIKDIKVFQPFLKNMNSK
ncbi:glycosyltransferase [Maribacter algarum]|uniref:Glycosyltransferase n=2 Tax=Maribacter algarum (ex Zhang et al. 2020) TaxID=2578118 RepID=A0A5S3PX54_9FLAO|nr:TIGR04282 family arsenosugar biosynthesis glycosyltransferase [Maribacter algarum]TMM59609.1 glycosyltransferase [Maribacter algarum]